MKRIGNSLKEFSAGITMRAHPMGEWAAARKHARAKQASLSINGTTSRSSFSPKWTFAFWATKSSSFAQ